MGQDMEPQNVEPGPRRHPADARDQPRHDGWRWRYTRSLLFALALLAATASPAAAHKLKVFATAEGPHVQGYVYLGGGVRPEGVPVRVLGPDGRVIAETTTGPEGRFSLDAAADGARTVVATTEGHQGTWTLDPAVEPAAPASTTGDTPATDTAALESLVEHAVARQIVPLREQLSAYEDRTRWHDVLGGLGWIAGLFGLVAWVSARRKG